MKVTRLLAIKLLCMSLPALSQTDQERSQRFSDCADHKSCTYEPHGQIERKYYAEGPWQGSWFDVLQALCCRSAIAARGCRP
jgi:hypothetical protein